MHRLYLSLGSNLGDREQTMRRAIELLGVFVGKVCRESSMIETEPWGFESRNKFLNMCVMLTTRLAPMEVLSETRRIETMLGRTVKTTSPGRYHDRPIDIDLLLYDDLRLCTPALTLPHPRMHERDFVMIPLAEIIDDDADMPAGESEALADDVRVHAT